MCVFQKIVTLLIIGVGVSNVVSAQSVFKVGNNPFKISSNVVALEVESTKGGFLPPRMSKVQRDLITSPTGLIVFRCENCKNDPALPPGEAELCVYLGTTWVSFTVSSSTTISGP